MTVASGRAVHTYPITTCFYVFCCFFSGGGDNIALVFCMTFCFHFLWFLCVIYFSRFATLCSKFSYSSKRMYSCASKKFWFGFCSLFYVQMNMKRARVLLSKKNLNFEVAQCDDASNSIRYSTQIVFISRTDGNHFFLIKSSYLV